MQWQNTFMAILLWFYANVWKIAVISYVNVQNNALAVFPVPENLGIDTQMNFQHLSNPKI